MCLPSGLVGLQQQRTELLNARKKITIQRTTLLHLWLNPRNAVPNARPVHRTARTRAKNLVSRHDPAHQASHRPMVHGRQTAASRRPSLPVILPSHPPLPNPPAAAVRYSDVVLRNACHHRRRQPQQTVPSETCLGRRTRNEVESVS